MKIVQAEIQKERFENQMIVTLENGDVRCAFTYYPDELSFSPNEVIGMTLSEARDLKIRKDVAYLRS